MNIIELAKQAGLKRHQEQAPGIDGVVGSWADLEAFAALIRADEAEKHKWDIHSCGPTCKRYACVAMREAVQAEREACAEVCKKHADVYAGLEQNPTAKSAWAACIDNRDAIRARGEA